MLKILCLGFVLTVVSFQSCKGRGGFGKSSLEETANAAPRNGRGLSTVLSSNKKKVYPSQKMIAAAKRALGEAQTTTDEGKFKKLLRTAKLQMRMRAFGTIANSETGSNNPGMIECTLASPAGSRTDKAKISIMAGDDDVVSSNGFPFRFKNSEGELTDYEYSYTLAVSHRDAGAPSLEVYLQENKVIEDEMGDFACDIPAGPGEFCNEPIDNEGEKVGDFFCRRT